MKHDGRGSLGFALEVMQQRRLDPIWAEELFR
jgi:hypothetical protein